MNRYQRQALGAAALSLTALASAPAHAASVTQVPRATWGASGVPNYVNMYIYVPDMVAAKPPIVVASHSCSTPVSGFFNSIQGIKAGADKTGFIIILPEATGQNCWDVGTTKSLTHDGGGDTHAVAQMVKYTLTKYNGDASRVYAMGGSSGAMMTQALLAVYPDVFRAGAARAGVAAGCWADGYASSNQWSNNCAGGRTMKSAQQWGDMVRGMYPGYMGHRPRVQLFHGTADGTINFNNLAESVKEWTNVLGLPEMATSTETVMSSGTTYMKRSWKNACGFTVFEAWAGQNGSHSMPYEQDAILAFLGLDKAGGADPEPDCPPGGGAGGAGGMGGGGAPASGGSGGSTMAGLGGAVTGGTGPSAGSGGTTSTAGSGGNSPAGGMAAGGQSGAQSGGTAGMGISGSAAGGSAGSGLPAGSAGTIGASGALGNGGSGVAGSSIAGSPEVPSSGAPGSPADPGTDSGGCTVSGPTASKRASSGLLALALALVALGRQRRTLTRR